MNNSITFGPTGTVGPIGLTGPQGQPGPTGMTQIEYRKLLRTRKIKKLLENGI